MTQKPPGAQPPTSAPEPDPEDGDEWVTDQAFELHKLISERRSQKPDQEDADAG